MKKIVKLGFGIIIIIIFSSGCISFRDEDHSWQIHYEAEYKNSFDFSTIINLFEIEKNY